MHYLTTKILRIFMFTVSLALPSSCTAFFGDSPETIQKKFRNACKNGEVEKALALRKKGALITGTARQDLINDMAHNINSMVHDDTKKKKRSIAAYRALGFVMSDVYQHFLNAVKTHYLGHVIHYLKEGINLNVGWATTTHNSPALILAAKNKDLRMINYLLEHGARPNIYHDHQTALSVAALQEDMESVDELLKLPNIEPNSMVLMGNKGQELPVPLLAVCADAVAAKLLSHANTDPNYGKAIHRALEARKQGNLCGLTRLSALLSHPKANPNQHELCTINLHTVQKTPLIFSIVNFIAANESEKKHWQQAIELLMKHPKIDPNIPDSDNITPIAWSLTSPIGLPLFNLLSKHPSIVIDQTQHAAAITLAEQHHESLVTKTRTLQKQQEAEHLTQSTQQAHALAPLIDKRDKHVRTVLEPLRDAATTTKTSPSQTTF